MITTRGDGKLNTYRKPDCIVRVCRTARAANILLVTAGFDFDGIVERAYTSMWSAR